MRSNHLSLLLAAVLSVNAAGVLCAWATRAHTPHGPQAQEESAPAARVKTAVAALATRPKARVRVTLFDLSEFEGRAAEPGEDSFLLVVRIAKDTFVERRVAYTEVLELRGGGFSLSFIPDQRLSPYGSWEAVRWLEFGDRVEVVLAGGERLKGRVNEATEAALSLLNPDGTTSEHDRQEVARVFRIGDGAGGAGAGAAGGMARGMRVRSPARTRQGDAVASVAGAGVGAGIGAVAGAARKKGPKRLLLFAK